MTIGIVVRGDKPGPALIDTMRAVESIAEGAIGGFVSLVTWHADHGIHHFACQHGGIKALFPDPLLPEIIKCQRLAMISSGANRPPPLARFLAWDRAGNLVSGHRFPQSPANGVPLNQRVLQLVQRQGASPSALATLLADYPSLDAGYVAMDADGGVAQINCQRVNRRADRSQSNFQSADYGFAFAFNSIQPLVGVGDLLCQRLHQALQAKPLPKLILDVHAKIIHSQQSRAVVDDALRVTEVLTPDDFWFEEMAEGALIETGMPIYRQNQILGYALAEPYALVSKGVITSLTGGSKISLVFLEDNSKAPQ